MCTSLSSGCSLGSFDSLYFLQHYLQRSLYFSSLYRTASAALADVAGLFTYLRDTTVAIMGVLFFKHCSMYSDNEAKLPNQHAGFDIFNLYQALAVELFRNNLFSTISLIMFPLILSFSFEMIRFLT
jgi:hypothetical protein